MRRIALVLLAALPLVAYGDVWAPGVWASGVWAPGVWAEDGVELVAVPDVVGAEDAEAAEMLLEADGLVLGAVVYRCSNEAEDEITGQVPPAGSLVSIGTAVNLFASNGEECPAGSGGNQRIGIRIGIGL